MNKEIKNNIEIEKPKKIDHQQLLESYNEYFEKQKRERQLKYGFVDEYLESIKRKAND